METAGFYILAFGVVCVVVLFWFGERKTPRTPIPDDDPADNRVVVRWGNERTGALTDEQRFASVDTVWWSNRAARERALTRRFDAEVEIRTAMLNLRIREIAREKRQIESGEILKLRAQRVLDFAPEGALVSIETNHHDSVRFLRVHNGTVNPGGSREEYAICVPNECRTVKAALAWTYGIEPDAYEEVVRT